MMRNESQHALKGQNNRMVKNRKFNSRMQAKLLLVFCVVFLSLLGLMGKLVYIVVHDGDRYAKHVLSRQSYLSAVLPYKRGDILDRNGTVLARSELQYKLILDPKRLLLNPDCTQSTINALEEYFQIEPSTVSEILSNKPDSQYVVLKKNLMYDAVNEFETLMEGNEAIKGIWFEEEYVRAYPYGTLASDVIGFTLADNTGYYGIEEYYNEELNGINGREYGYYDSTLNIERTIKKAENGNSIVSTIDANAQRIIQKHIKEFNAEFGSKNISILIMDPNNGEIIAMASNTEFDLNDPRNLQGILSEEEISQLTDEMKMDALNELWKNDVISSGFEPGSTFKPVTIGAALEEGLVSVHSTFICDGGEQVGGSYIKCSRKSGHGEITLAEALKYSCNDALMQIAELSGRSIFYQYQNRLGLGRKTGIDLPGEEAGILIPEDGLNLTELATSSFGQSFTVTNLQLAAAYASLVNGGYYYQPHIARKIINDNGATVKEFGKTLVRQTVSPSTSKFIQEAMYLTVEEGTAKWAKVPGYAVGGKTGTAQKLPRDAKTYVVSFIGAVPAINPEMVIHVAIDEPQNVVKQADSSIATKLASRVLIELLPAIGIYPEGEIDYLLPKNDEDGAITNESTAANGDNSANEATSNNDNSQVNNNTDTEHNNSNGADQEVNDSSNDEQGDNEVIENSGTDEDIETGDTTETEDDIEAPINNSFEALEEDFEPDAIGVIDPIDE